MFYNKINNPKKKIYRVILNCFLILAYLISYSGCETTSLYNVPPGDLNTGSTADIIKIVLKNGTELDCEGIMISIERDQDSSLVYVIRTDEPVEIRSGGEQKYGIWRDVRIPEKDIKALSFEKTVSDPTMTGLAVGGGILILAAVIALITFANSMDNMFHLP